MVLKSLLNSIKERNFRGIAKQTEQLDPQTRQHLQEYLHSNLGTTEQQQEQELEELQDELQAATIRLSELQEKEDFIGTRLQAYQSKLKAIKNKSDKEEAGGANEDEEDDDATVLPNMSLEKQQEHTKALEQIQQIHKTMKHNISILQKKMKAMEQRKLELSWHLEECQVVLKTTKEMEQAETELAFEEVTDGIVTDDDDDGDNEDEDVTIPVPTNNKKGAASMDDADEEAGQIEMTVYDLEAKDNAVITSISRNGKEDEDEKERIHKEEGIEDALASRLAIADEQV